MKKIILFLFGFILIVVLTYLIRGYFGAKRISDWQFAGRVGAMKLNARVLPTLKLDNQIVFIRYYGGLIKKDVEVGDNLIKLKGSTQITLIKQKTKQRKVYGMPTFASLMFD